jgi:cytochrome c553
VPWILLAGFFGLVSCRAQPQQESQAKSEFERTSEYLSDYMGAHFEQVILAQKAIIRGDIDGVREPTRWLSERRPIERLPVGWEPHVDELQVAARLASEARTYRASAAATASMMRICGKCHEAVGAEARVPELGARGIPPSDQIQTVPRMLRHQWAVERMLMGLINPSDEAWNNGAEVLADAPLEPRKMTGETSQLKSVGEMAQQVHELGAEAQNVQDWQARALLYGELLATCAQCHDTLGIAIALE